MKLSQSLVGESLILAAVTLASAMLVNSLRSDGLSLCENHFLHPAPGTGEGVQGEALEHDYVSWDLPTTQEYHKYTGDEDGIVFLDARSRKSYDKGHIPNAYLCDPYRHGDFIPDLLEKLKAADYVLIYCTGGDCEDSIELATRLVFEYGVPADLIAIFDQGWSAWVEAGLDTEVSP